MTVRNANNYHTYCILIGFNDHTAPKMFYVTAVDFDAAMADLSAAYTNFHFITYSVHH